MAKKQIINWEGREFILRSDPNAMMYKSRIMHHAPDPLKFQNDFGRLIQIGDNNGGHCVLFGIFYFPNRKMFGPVGVNPTWGFVDRSIKRISEPDITAQLLLLHGVTSNQ